MITRAAVTGRSLGHGCDSRVDRLAISAGDRRILRSAQPAATDGDRRLATPGFPKRTKLSSGERAVDARPAPRQGRVQRRPQRPHISRSLCRDPSARATAATVSAQSCIHERGEVSGTAPIRLDTSASVGLRHTRGRPPRGPRPAFVLRHNSTVARQETRFARIRGRWVATGGQAATRDASLANTGLLDRPPRALPFVLAQAFAHGVRVAPLCP